MRSKSNVTISAAQDEIHPPVPLPVWKTVSTPPIIPGERVEDYQEFFNQISTAVRPRDMIEWLLTEDAVALAWEVNRLRRLKAAILRAAQEPALRELLVERIGVGQDEARRTAEYYRAGYDRRKVHKLLRARGLDMDMVMGKAFERKSQVIEQLDRMLVAASARRDAVLREIDRRRDSLAARVRRAIEIAGGSQDVTEVVDVSTS
jgi:hypothetical protein